MKNKFVILLFVATVFVVFVPSASVRCNETHAFQRRCQDDDEDFIEMQTCPENTTDGRMLVECRVLDGVVCDGARTFAVERPCLVTNGVVFELAVCLSALLGCFGLDRCYLGYITMGFLKFVSFGGFLMWWIFDLVLISSQVIGPADKSNYVILSNIPRMTHYSLKNHSVFQ